MSSSKGESSNTIPKSREIIKQKDQLKVITVKSSFSDIGWKSDHIKSLKTLVQNLENNKDFNLDEYAVQGFYREVFFSLLDYKPRDGGEGGKSTLSNKVKNFRNTLKKYLETYKKTTLYKPIKLPNAQKIANYETAKIATSYNNNVMLQFGNRLRMFINKIVGIKDRITLLKNELKRDNYSEVDIKDRIKKTIIDPVNQLKLAISTRDINKIPKDFLDDKSINCIKKFMSAYPKNYKFKKESIYYDAKACPEKHLFAYYKLAKICEDSKIKSFNCFPLRRSYIPSHMTIDTMILNNHIVKNSSRSKLNKDMIWGNAVNLSSKAMKPQGHNKSIAFKETILTDGIAVSIIKQNLETGKGPSNRSKSTAIEENVAYIENVSKEELSTTIGKCVFIDPGRRDLLYCMHENSNNDNKLLYRYTRNQKSVETKSIKFRKLRQKFKPADVLECENKLSKHVISTVNIEKFINYLKVKAEVEPLLINYYSNENTEKDKRDPNLLPFRKMKLSSYINNIQANKKLAKNLRTKFGQDCILILGDWSGAHTKFHEPIRGKGNRTMLRKEGFKVYLLNEFKTSSVCPSCNNPKLEKFKDCVNPRPFQRKKRPTVKCHGLLRCPNKKCLKNMAPAVENSHRVYNRDLVAVLNFRQIVISIRENLTRPEVFKRKNTMDNIILKKPRIE